jgi:glycosyltransferase involved in cell wall biosynthesis
MRWLYPSADAVIAVSKGVAEDLVRITGLSPKKIAVIANPVLTPRMESLAAEKPAHPWLQEKTVPVIIGAGRLTRQKDFSTLIRAFARLRKIRRCRLIILGEGNDKQTLGDLAKALTVESDIDFPGFVDNPYAIMKAADLFVLSSIWEGSPNVLTEAMGLGVPVAATDCPSGPREILQEGQFGPLVKMGDDQGLAEAMQSVLDKPPSPEFIKQAVAQYRLETSSRRYLEVLLGQDGETNHRFARIDTNESTDQQYD